MRKRLLLFAWYALVIIPSARDGAAEPAGETCAGDLTERLRQLDGAVFVLE